MRTVAIIQARAGSSRLPAKVLADIAGATMLARVVERLRAAPGIDAIVVATTTARADDQVAAEADRIGTGVFRGSEHDVLARYVGAARAWHAGVVVRITADCPLLDPTVVGNVVAALRTRHHIDYASNTHVRTFPRGLDTEAFFMETLERIHAAATSGPAREHVTAYILEQRARFSVHQVCAEHDDSDLRWTVDTAEDLALVRALYARLALDRSASGPRPVSIPPYQEVVELMRADPALGAINDHIVQKPWHAESHVA